MAKKRDNGENHIPFSIEIKIYDKGGTPIFHWRPARGNIEKGLEKTGEFIETKLLGGVSLDEVEKYLPKIPRPK